MKKAVYVRLFPKMSIKKSRFPSIFYFKMLISYYCTGTAGAAG